MATRVKLAELLVELIAKTDEFTKPMEGVKKDTKNLTHVLGDVARGAGKVMAGAFKIAAGAAVGLAGGIVAAGGALTKLALNAAPLQGIGQSFDNLSQKFGVSLDAMKKAAGGTVSDFDLMRKANVALTGAGEKFGAEFGKNIPALLQAARGAAKATGQDVDFLFESLVSGIKKCSPLLIDNTGLVLKTTEANEAMAKSLGKSVDELTAEEKQIALLNATVEAGNKLIDDMGGLQVTAAEQIAQAKAQFKNFTDQLGLAFLPVIEAILPPLMDLATKIMPIVVNIVEKAGKFLSTFINLLSQGGDPLAAFKVSLWETFGVTLGGLKEVALQKLALLWESIRVWFASQDWGAHAQTAMMLLGQAFSNVDWAAIGLKIVNLVITGLAQFGLLVLETLLSWSNAFYAWVETVDWYTVGFNIVTAIIEGLVAFFEFVAETVSGWYTSISTGVSGLDWGTIGSSIIDGIKGGILAKASALATAAVEAAKGAWNAVTSFIGAKSPSTLFAQTVGQPIAQGMALGIAQGAPQIDMALNDAIMSAIKSTGQDNSITNNNFNMTVNTQATTPTVVQDFRTMMGVVSA